MQFTFEHASLQRVVDGDTLIITVDMGFGVFRHDLNVRLDKIDTPECCTSNALEKQAGKLVSAYVFQLLATQPGLILISFDLDKYGRVLGDIEFTRPPPLISAAAPRLTDHLLCRRFAREYAGGTRVEWPVDTLLTIISELDKE